MTQFNDYLYPMNEAHVRLHYDGDTFHLDGLPEGCEPEQLPEAFRRGMSAIYNLLETMAPGLSCISVLGVWFHREPDSLVAFALWLQLETEGFYLPMATSASLFRENGIPYFHKPLI